MPAFVPDDDDTIELKPAAPLHPRRSIFKPLGAGVLAAIAAGSGWYAWRRSGSSASETLTADFPIEPGTEAGIDATEPCNTKLTYFSLDKNIVVIDFPTLTAQGLTLDRIAAFVEKAHTPRNRVLNDPELATAIAASGADVATYYYGHDYQAADLRRFFTRAAAENILLNPHELWLRTFLMQLGWLKAGRPGAIITVPAAGRGVTPDMRAVILHHEISHGAFYTVPGYRAYAESFWYGLTEFDRARFTGFLGREGYDTSNTELMLNETQAYLVFTRDKRFFNAGAVGMTEASVSQLRESFVAGMPDFWLRPLADAPPPRSRTLDTCTAAIHPRSCICFAGRGIMAPS